MDVVENDCTYRPYDVNPRRRPRGQLARLLGALLVVSGQPLVLVVELL
jgi:hypothetical protein